MNSNVVNKAISRNQAHMHTRAHAHAHAHTHTHTHTNTQTQIYTPGLIIFLYFTLLFLFLDSNFSKKYIGNLTA